ncbi:hypothetical protein ACS386_12440 [Flavobacteriaceae bacterium LMO-SS05]
MKNIICISLLLLTAPVFAQEKPKNVSEEVETTTIKVNNGTEVKEKKVKVTTRKEQHIKLDEKDKNKMDQDIVESPVKVKKTIEIDYDGDNSYDSKVEVGYYEFEGKRYHFKKMNNGFLVSSENKQNPNDFGSIVRFNKENHYLFRNADTIGIGYFNTEGNFVIEYYDKKSGELVSQEFMEIK